MSLLAVAYCRVSTAEQATRGHSLDAQQHAIRHFCRQKGWRLLRIYADEGLSGSRDDRPALQQLLRDARHQAFEVVIVHAIDRFYRSLSGLLAALDLLRRHNVSFVSLTENLDFTTPWGKLTLALLGTLAEIYLDRLRAETSKGLRQRARKGLHNGSVPFGYCKGLCSRCTDLNGPGYCPLVGRADRGDGEVLLPHPLESVGLRRIFRLSALCRFSDRDIADYLNQTPVRFGGRDYILRPKRPPHHVRRYGPPVFGKDAIREILQRPFYTGVVPYYGTDEQGRKRKRGNPVALYPGRHPPLIPQALFERAQEVRRDRRFLPPANPDAPHAFIYPLSGLLFCGECGARMRGSCNRQRTRYYRCSARIQQRQACRQPAVPADRLEEQVAALLSALSLPSDWRDRIARRPRLDDDARAARRQGLRRKLERLQELYLEGEIDRDRYRRRRQNYREQLRDLTNTDRTDMIATAYILQQPEVFATDDLLVKKKLLQAMLAAVIVQGGALTAWQANSALYPLLSNTPLSAEEKECLYGSDGT